LKLSRVARVAYALPAFALAVVGIPVYVFVPKFYTGTVGVDLKVAGAILGGVRVFDAVLDPLVGVLSDRTRTRLGRRRPWVVLGSVPLALALVLLLSPIPSGAAAAPWFAASLFSLFFFWAAVTVPYESLGMELSDDYDDRTRLLGLRDGVLIAGTLAAASTPFAITKALGLGEGPDAERLKFRVMASIYAILLLTLCTGCALLVPERPLSEKRPRSVFDPATLKTLIANRPFVIVLLAYFVGAIGSNLPGLLMPYYVEQYLHSPNTSAYLALYFVIGIAFLPLWIGLSRRTSKKAVWLAAMAVNSGAFFFVFFLGRGDERLYALIVALSGVGFGATLAIPSSLQADVLDYDELLSGERREGLLLGVWCILRKLAPALPVGIALPIMKSAGWDDSRTDQTEHAFLVLKVLYAIVPTVCSAVAFAIAWRYPIDRKRHTEILAALASRSKGERA
jgi:GPH family glycoside/pentoside/hexuronide:cation symporter